MARKAQLPPREPGIPRFLFCLVNPDDPNEFVTHEEDGKYCPVLVESLDDAYDLLPLLKTDIAFVPKISRIEVKTLLFNQAYVKLVATDPVIMPLVAREER